MEYRAWIQVPGIDIEGDDAGLLLDALEERYGSFGPVLSGIRDGIEVILSADEPDGVEGKARALMLGVVAETLLFSGLDQRPAGIRLERVGGDVAVA